MAAATGTIVAVAAITTIPHGITGSRLDIAKALIPERRAASTRATTKVITKAIMPATTKATGLAARIVRPLLA